MTATKAELRDQIAELGLDQPPSTASKAELAAIVAGNAAPDPATPAPPAGRRAGRCPAGVPLFTGGLCRGCYLDAAVCKAER